MTAHSLYRSSFQHLSRGNDYFIWLIAIVLSLASHFIFFLQRQPLIEAPSSVIQETITHVRFATIAPPPVNVSEPELTSPRTEPIVAPETVVMQQQKPEPVVSPKPLPKPAPKTKPVPKPEKRNKPVIKPKPQVRKKTSKAKPPAKKRIPEVKQRAITPSIQNKTTTVNTSPVVAEADARLIEQTRKSYHALLMQHIEVHKNYPRVARKRNIQGKILVTFTVFADGSIKHLSLSGKKSILKKATKQAVNNALPMPKPPKGLSFPMNIKFTMNYSLQ